MQGERFGEICEKLRKSQVLNDYTAGEKPNWYDVFSAIENDGEELAEEIQISQVELGQWKEEACMYHADRYPFTEESA